MARIKRGIVSRRKHKKLLQQTKGFRGTKSRLVRVAKEAALHAGAYAYHGRKIRKRDIRSLWITHISEAVKFEGISYSVFMNKLKKENIELDRKILADLVVNDLNTFKHIVNHVNLSSHTKDEWESRKEDNRSLSRRPAQVIDIVKKD